MSSENYCRVNSLSFKQMLLTLGYERALGNKFKIKKGIDFHCVRRAGAMV
jgi:hypothetical protein